MSKRRVVKSVEKEETFVVEFNALQAENMFKCLEVAKNSVSLHETKALIELHDKLAEAVQEKQA